MRTDQRIAMLQGKIIGIIGIIELYQGKPEIEVTSTDQIKGLDSAGAVIRPTHSVVVNEMTSPDELMKVLTRYVRESDQSERVVASRIGVNHHTLHRWLTDGQSPMKRRLALTACFLKRVGYL